MKLFNKDSSHQVDGASIHLCSVYAAEVQMTLLGWPDQDVALVYDLFGRLGSKVSRKRLEVNGTTTSEPEKPLVPEEPPECIALAYSHRNWAASSEIVLLGM
jgi:hypothetical protein